MTRDPRWTLFRPADLAVAAALLALAAGFAPRLAAPFGTRAEVTVDGRKAARLSLEGPDREFAVPTSLGPMRLRYGAGGVRVVDAPCPNRLCLRSGPAARSGAAIVCVPCRVRITVTGGRRGEEPDAVTY